MKRLIAVVLLLLLVGTALAIETTDTIQVPEEYTEHEAEIYRKGYLAGYQAAQEGVLEERHPVNGENEYVINKSSGRFHYPSCNGVQSMSEKNKEFFHGTREELIAKGYQPCGSCDP